MTAATTPSPTAGPAATELVARSVVLKGLSGEPVHANLVDVGQGRPVVFLHGLVGLNEHWDEVLPRVRHRVRCIMLELPLLALRGDDCSIEGATELTARFLDSYLDETAILAGNSFGGHIALRIAIARPNLVRGLVLAGSSGLIEKQVVAEIQLRPSRPWVERKISELFYDKSIMRQGDVDRAFAALSSRDGARAMLKLSKSARRDHLGDRLGGVRAPSLLIWGRNDVVTPPEAAHEFLERLPQSRIAWFDRCGHAPMMEAPAQFAEALLAFADELDRRPR